MIFTAIVLYFAIGTVLVKAMNNTGEAMSVVRSSVYILGWPIVIAYMFILLLGAIAGGHE